MNEELVKRLRAPTTINSDPGLINAERRLAADAIEQLLREVETWKDRVEAERQAHEATIKEFQRISND